MCHIFLRDNMFYCFQVDLLKGQKTDRVDVTLLPEELDVDVMENVLAAKYDFCFLCFVCPLVMLTSCILFLTSARTIPGMMKQGRKRNYGVSVRISVTWLLRCVAFNPQIIQTCTLFYKKFRSLFAYLIISIWCRMRRKGRGSKKKMASPRRKTSSFKVVRFLFILHVNGRRGKLSIHQIVIFHEQQRIGF